MTLVEKIKLLCESKETTFAALERELGFGQGSIRKWDTSSPAAEKLQKVADYFGVSTDYLLGRDEYAQPAIIGAAAHLDTNDPEAIEEYNKLVEYLNFKYSKKD